MDKIFSDRTVSITEFKVSPKAKLAEAQGRPLAVLINNRPEFYAVPAALFAKIADIMDDIMIADTVRSRMADGRFVDVELKDL